MSLVGPIAPELAGDRGFMHAQQSRARRVCQRGAQERVDLIPFFSGELGVGSHVCSFDWLIERDDVEPTSPRPSNQLP